MVVVPVVVVAVAVAVDVGVAVRVAVNVAVAREVVDVAVAVEVAVAVARAVVAVAVAVDVPHAPSFTHQLSLLGSKGELGGQSRFAGIGAIVWYKAPPKVALAPLAYAVHVWNAATPVQFACANAVCGANRTNARTATPPPARTFLIFVLRSNEWV
jgi:hypothetical protein